MKKSGIFRFFKIGKKEELKDDNWEEEFRGAVSSNSGSVYSVNEYAYVKIDVASRTYEVLEPPLNEEDLKILSIARDLIPRNMTLNSKGLKEAFDQALNDFFETYSIPEKRRLKLSYYLLRDFLGYGKIDALMRDPMIEDISCSGANLPVYVYHQLHGSLRTNIIFGREELDSFVCNLAQRCGKHISIAEPIIDASLPDGSRANITFQNEVSTKGSTFTIRKFKQRVLTPLDLIRSGSISAEMLAYLWMMIERKASILVAGEVATGKTTLVNAFSLFIPKNMKIVSIEDTPEIRLPHENWIPLVTRMGFFGEGKSITMFDLLKASLRQRPDYIIIGEIRGEEAQTLFQAMSTGHLALGTIHAKSPKAVIERLISPPMNVPKIMVSLLDCICMQTIQKDEGGVKRKTSGIWEVISEGEEIMLKDVFIWNGKSFEYRGCKKLMTISGRSGFDPEKEMRRRAELLNSLASRNLDFADFWKVISDESRIS
jgi:flagellar protein FlaI